MAKKKVDNRSIIINAYTAYVLRYGKKPSSVFVFAEDNKLKESDFYAEFGTFEALEKAIFNMFFANTITLLKKNAEYKTFDAKNKLLSFYYTFFEVLKANRSYVQFALVDSKDKLGALSLLSDLRRDFQNYIEEIDIHTLDIPSELIDNIKDKGLKEAAWTQLLLTMKFWMDDSSADFEKTDLFIEKSLNASFDLIDTTPLQSIVDFGKFLFKEKINPAS